MLAIWKMSGRLKSRRLPDSMFMTSHFIPCQSGGVAPCASDGLGATKEQPNYIPTRQTNGSRGTVPALPAEPVAATEAPAWSSYAPSGTVLPGENPNWS